MCKNCESDKREMWGPSRNNLDLELVHTGNWISLEKCTECSALWVFSPYEPYSSFPYWVKWNFTPEVWKKVHQIEQGKILRDWHIYSIKKLWAKLPESEKKSIEAHRERSYNYYNPVDMPVDNVELIEEIIITAHNSA